MTGTLLKWCPWRSVNAVSAHSLQAAANTQPAVIGCFSCKSVTCSKDFLGALVVYGAERAEAGVVMHCLRQCRNQCNENEMQPYMVRRLTRKVRCCAVSGRQSRHKILL
jgi:hypothetical protein